MCGSNVVNSTSPSPPLPMVLRLLDQVTMATHRGIDMVRPKEGSYGFIVKIFAQNGSKIAVKMFKHTVDSELAFLGVDYDIVTMKHVLNISRRNKYQRILYDAGFVPTVLRQSDPTCPVCKCIVLQKQHSHDEESIHHRANVWLSRKVHYHVYMPLMDGNLHELLRTTYFTLEQRIRVFLEVAHVMQKLSLHDVINPDLKAPNILYRGAKKKYIYAPCDVGGLYVVGQPHVDLDMDTFKRFLVTDSTSNGKRFIGKSNEEDKTKYNPLTKNETSREIKWTIATYVNIFLQAQHINTNYDLSESTHLTNQFSILAFFMYMVFITPPSHVLVSDRTTYLETMDHYPTMDKYLDDHMGNKLRAHRLCKPILKLIREMWSTSSQWRLLGTKKTYVGNMIQRIQDLLHVTEHTSPPRKILRHAKLDEE